MATEDVNRQKAAMVVFSLEKALGDYVKNKHDALPDLAGSGTIQKIEARLNNPTPISNKLRINRSVASSYIEEVINLAVECSAATADLDNLKTLQILSSQLDLFSIRNAASHPNRPFPDCYWYRAAALASDPVIDKLAFTTVRMALQAAEEGKITPPPEEWFDFQYSFIRNNLPRQFEHEATGLIGRQKEKRDLLSFLAGGKYSLIAIVAPGGLGKTSLALDVLRECSLEPKAQDWCDAIVFVSLKQEKLTADGVQTLSASQTLDELGVELTEELSTLYPDIDCADFAAVTPELANERILLCIDNLETLLVNNQEAFSRFFESMPGKWRVLITSRITVDGAKTLPIGALTSDGAKALIYKYLSAKGIDAPIEAVVAQIIGSSGCNPLALRLIIDRFANGHSLPTAAAQAEKDIVAFSYKNLLETLTENAVLILEALFVKDQFVRGELVELLGLDSDSTAEAVRQLTRTSLVIRHSDGTDERFSLSPSIRDLLRDLPRNLAIRQKVKFKIDAQSKAVRQHKFIQAQHGFSPLSEDFIPDDCPPNLGAVLVMAIKLLRAESHSHQQVIAALDRLTQAVKSYPDNSQAFVTLGRLHIKVNDDLGAESYFKQAIHLAKDHPTPRIVYQDYLLQRERPDEALTISESLIAEGWGAEPKSDDFTARRVWNSHFRILIENGLYDRLIEVAPLANSNKSLLDLGRCATAQAIICKVQPLHSDNPKDSLIALGKAAKLLFDRPLHERVRSHWARTFRYLCKELHHLIDTQSLLDFEHASIEPCIHCIARHAAEVYENVSLYAVRNEVAPVLRFLKKQATEIETKLFDSNWISGLVSEQLGHASIAKKMISEGYRILTIYKVPYSPGNIPSFMFAEDEKQQRYFVAKHTCKNFEFVSWAQLRVGSQIAGRSFSVPSTQKDYPSPSEVMLLL
jgi:tetratricopeptide (TPR) repeat protein